MVGGFKGIGRDPEGEVAALGDWVDGENEEETSGGAGWFAGDPEGNQREWRRGGGSLENRVWSKMD